MSTRTHAETTLQYLVHNLVSRDMLNINISARLYTRDWHDIRTYVVEPGIRFPLMKSHALNIQLKSSIFEWFLQKLEDIKTTH